MDNYVSSPDGIIKNYIFLGAHGFVLPGRVNLNLSSNIAITPCINRRKFFFHKKRIHHAKLFQCNTVNHLSYLENCFATSSIPSKKTNLYNAFGKSGKNPSGNS